MSKEDLIGIKADEQGTNKSLEIELEVTKVKLSSYNINTKSLEKMILGK